MMYMTPQSTPSQPLGPEWGQMFTPGKSTTTPESGRQWCLDNGVFTGRFDPVSFWRTLEQMTPYRDTCLFIVAPDVVGDALATLEQFRHWGPRIQAAGWPVAFVAQDGQELLPFPPEYDALFIGGSTEWKLSAAALDCIRRAKADGRHVHVGRVNSQKRMAHFQLAGVDSVDGTSVCFAPANEYRVLSAQLAKRPLLIL